MKSSPVLLQLLQYSVILLAKSIQLYKKPTAVTHLLLRILWCPPVGCWWTVGEVDTGSTELCQHASTLWWKHCKDVSQVKKSTLRLRSGGLLPLGHICASWFSHRHFHRALKRKRCRKAMGVIAHTCMHMSPFTMLPLLVIILIRCCLQQGTLLRRNFAYCSDTFSDLHTIFTSSSINNVSVCFVSTDSDILSPHLLLFFSSL